ncbi:MAG: hypothetical protein ACT4NY_10570 [Pseudonocardiales bacterium]
MNVLEQRYRFALRMFPASYRQGFPMLGLFGPLVSAGLLLPLVLFHARRPTARLSMPSKLVDDMWHEMVLHTRDYAAFCDTAFGRFLHHEPESNMSPKQALANRSERLLATLLLARVDEDCTGVPGRPDIERERANRQRPSRPAPLDSSDALGLRVVKCGEKRAERLGVYYPGE